MSPLTDAERALAREVIRERERKVFAVVERIGQDIRAREAPRMVMSQAEKDAPARQSVSA